MEIWKTLCVFHIPTPPAATTDKCLTRRTLTLHLVQKTGLVKSGRVGDTPDEHSVAQSITRNDCPTLARFRFVRSTRLHHSAVTTQMSPKVKGRVIAGRLERVPSTRSSHDFARGDLNFGDHEINDLGWESGLVQDFSYHRVLVIALRHLRLFPEEALTSGGRARNHSQLHPFALEVGLWPAFLAANA